MERIQKDTLRFGEKFPGYNGPDIGFRDAVELGEVGDGPVDFHIGHNGFCSRLGFLLSAFTGLEFEDIELEYFDKQFS